ncbi:Gfo/Idh/MocA family oxidoreductase [Burkholderiaceae bacterium DAT-1]|nr:Gfo/Idh/MocA family oxidoreductase [Burkholderiaceae bacterium DAT-1]
MHRVGFIGAGGLRGKLADLVASVGRGIVLTAAADPNPAALQAFRNKHGEHIRLCGDYRELLAGDDVDSVFIISPDHFHEEHACAALEAGKAVYLEKPLAISVAGCDRILDTAYRTGTKLFVGHNLRYFPVLQTMKSLIDAGVIGEVKAIWCRHFVSYGGDAYFKDWHSEICHTGGLLLQKGAHDIDMIHWLAGAPTRRVCAMGTLAVYGDTPRRATADPVPPVRFDTNAWPPGSNGGMSPHIDVEDHNMVLMQLGNGVQASYLQCHFTPDAVRNYTVIGTRGRLENIGDSGECAIHLFNTRTDRFGEPDRVIPVASVDGSHAGADPAIIRAFFDFVLDGIAPSVTPVDARQAVVTGVCATECLKAGGGAANVPELDPVLLNYFHRHQETR